MNNIKKFFKESFLIRKYAIFIAVFWTFLLAGLLQLDIKLIKREAIDRAYNFTKVGFEKDIIYRSWVADHGGIYVKVDSTTPPNPYLSHIPDRDIIIDSSLQFTLMNPAYMTRQVYELQKTATLLRGHITSLNPIRPENAPDDWERKALEAFENGIEECAEMAKIDGEDYFRYMKPFLTEKSCLKCHAHQGYKINDIRGGISVSYPFDKIQIITTNTIRNQFLLYGIIWIMGLGGLVLSYLSIKKSFSKRLEAENTLRILNTQLEEKVELRSQELQKTNRDWENIFNTLGTPAQLIDNDHIIKFVNKETLRGFNVKKEDVIGKKCYTLFHLSKTTHAKCPLTESFVEGKSRSEELLFEFQDKTYIVSCSKIYDIDGKLQHFIRLMIDISVQRKMDKELVESKNRFKTIFNSVNDAIFIHDKDTGEILDVNSKVCEMLGYEHDNILKMNVGDFSSGVTPYTNNEAIEWINKSTKKQQLFEWQIKNSKGEIIWVEVNMRQAQIGKIDRVLVSARDISERKKIDEKVKQLNKDLDKRIKELGLLLEVSQSLTRTHELENILQTITDFSAQLISIDTTAIYLVIDDQLSLGAATPPIPDELPDEFRFALKKDHPNINKCISTLEPVLIHDVSKAKFSEAEKVINESMNFKTLLYIPLVIETRAVGVLILGSINAIREFSKNEIDLFITLSIQSALVIENTLLFKESKDYSEKLETNIEQLTDAEKKINDLNIDLEKKIKERTEELETKNIELLRINRLFVGRELRMKELKEEVEKLKKK